MRFKFLTVIVLFFVLALSCSKEEVVDEPPWSASFEINLATYPGTKLSGLNTYLACPDELISPKGYFGLAGVIVSHTYTEGAYMAFDRCCRNPSCESNRVPVNLGTPEKPKDYGYAHCPVCKSVYLLYLGTGEVESGPATKSLWIYPGSSLRKQGNYLRLSYSG